MRKTIREWVEESNASHIQLAMPDMRDLYRKSKGKWQRFALGRTGSGLRGKPGFEELDDWFPTFTERWEEVENLPNDGKMPCPVIPVEEYLRAHDNAVPIFFSCLDGMLIKGDSFQVEGVRYSDLPAIAKELTNIGKDTALVHLQGGGIIARRNPFDVRLWLIHQSKVSKPHLMMMPIHTDD